MSWIPIYNTLSVIGDAVKYDCLNEEQKHRETIVLDGIEIPRAVFQETLVGAILYMSRHDFIRLCIYEDDDEKHPVFTASKDDIIQNAIELQEEVKISCGKEEHEDVFNMYSIPNTDEIDSVSLEFDYEENYMGELCKSIIEVLRANFKNDALMINFCYNLHYYLHQNGFIYKYLVAHIFYSYRYIDHWNNVPQIPQEVVSLCLKCLDGITSLYEPFAYSNIAFEFAPSDYQGQTIDKSKYITQIIAAGASGFDWQNVTNESCFYNWDKKHSQTILVCPPYKSQLGNYSTDENSLVERIYENLCDSMITGENINRQALLILPLESLYIDGKCQEYRKALTKNNIVDKIILLPDNLFPNTRIQYALIILKTNKLSTSTKLYDMSSCITEDLDRIKDDSKNEFDFEKAKEIVEKDNKEYSVEVTISDIENQQFDWYILRYSPNSDNNVKHGYRTIKFSDILTEVEDNGEMYTMTAIVTEEKMKSSPFEPNRIYADKNIDDVKFYDEKYFNCIQHDIFIVNFRDAISTAWYHDEDPVMSMAQVCAPNYYRLFRINSEMYDIDYIRYLLHKASDKIASIGIDMGNEERNYDIVMQMKAIIPLSIQEQQRIYAEEKKRYQMDKANETVEKESDYDDVNFSVDAICEKYNEARDADCRIYSLEIMSKLYLMSAEDKGHNRNIDNLLEKKSIHFVDGILSETELNFLYKYKYKETIEYCCHCFHHPFIEFKEGIFVGAESLYKGIAELASYFTKYAEGKTVYFPFAWIGDFPLSYECGNMIIEEQDELACIATQIRLETYGKHAIVSCIDFDKAVSKNHEIYEYIACSLLRNQDLNETVISLYKALLPNGQLDIIVPNKFLVSDEYKECRKYITDQNALHMIINLPEKKSYIKIIKQPQEEVILYDGSDCEFDKGINAYDLLYEMGIIEEWHEDEDKEDYVNYIAVGMKSIAESNYNWLPFYHDLCLSNKAYIRLKNIISNDGVTIINGVDASPDSYFHSAIDSFFSDNSNVAEITDAQPLFKDEIKRYEHYAKEEGEDKALIDLLNSNPKDLKYYCVKAGTPFLLFKKGTNGIAFSNGLDKDLLVSGGTHVFLPKEGYKAIEIAYLFESKEVITQLDMFELSENTIDSLLVPSLSDEERRELVLNKNVEARKKAEAALANAFDEYKLDTRMKKHAIGQNMANLSGYSMLLKQAAKEGAIQTDYVLGKKHPMSVGTVLNNMSEMIGTISYLMSNFNICEDDKYKETEKISLNLFVKEYMNTHEESLYIGVRTLDAPDAAAVRFSRVALRQIFDNIISNAKDYGFDNVNNGDNKILFRTSVKDDFIEVLIANNGKPLAKDANSKNIFNFAWSSKLGKGHSGLGCYQVKKLMENFGGKVDVVIDPTDQFSVGFILKFPLNNNI